LSNSRVSGDDPIEKPEAACHRHDGRRASVLGASGHSGFRFRRNPVYLDYRGAAFAEFWSAVINERVVAGIRNAQSKGTRSGRLIGRPRRIFNRGQLLELRKAGLSLSQIGAATRLLKTTNSELGRVRQ
jgi:hypothetical protein